MKTIKYFMLAVTAFLGTANYAQNKLEVVSTFPDARPGNVAVSPEGRVFITMSALGESKFMVKEILPDGSAVPFPDEEWITKPTGKSMKGINATIGIHVSNDNTLWVLDMGDDKPESKKAAKLVGFNIKTKKMVKLFAFPEDVLQFNSFLQDFIIDEKNQIAVIADMTYAGLLPPIKPAFIVVDLKTGYSRRVLESDASFMPINEPVVINNRPVSHLFPNGGVLQPSYPLNPISIDPQREWIYFGAMGGTKIYRIKSELLANEKRTDAELSKQIEFYTNKPKSDGFKVGNNGKIYVTDVEQNAVGVATPQSYTVLAQDDRLLSWPDGVSISKDGYLYIVSNQLHNLAWLNNNTDTSKPPYYVVRLKIN
jgi:hypothetical protein